MVNGLYTSTAGMLPRIVQMDTLANDLANVSTNGYKKSAVFLRTLIDARQALDHAMGKEQSPRPEEVWVDHTQGNFEKTGNTFDLALNGPGYFRVRDTEGNIYYTRDGRFHLDPNGVLINNSGMNLLDERSNAIVIDGSEVGIVGDGSIFVDGEKTATIDLADFAPADYHALEGVGNGLFKKPDTLNEGVVSAGTKVMQEYLEDANIDPVRGMVDMIEIFRTYELGQKAIQIQDQTLQKVVTEVGSVR